MPKVDVLATFEPFHVHFARALTYRTKRQKTRYAFRTNDTQTLSDLSEFPGLSITSNYHPDKIPSVRKAKQLLLTLTALPVSIVLSNFKTIITMFYSILSISARTIKSC